MNRTMIVGVVKDESQKRQNQGGAGNLQLACASKEAKSIFSVTWWIIDALLFVIIQMIKWKGQAHR